MNQMILGNQVNALWIEDNMVTSKSSMRKKHSLIGAYSKVISGNNVSHMSGEEIELWIG
jgi:hypothetical protein